MFIKSFKKNLYDLDIFNTLNEEMMKYKTLAHATINWDNVFKCSYEILAHHSLDMKICYYFAISCTEINDAKSYSQLLDLLKHIQDNFDIFNEIYSEKELKSQIKFLKQLINFFIENANDKQFICDNNIINQFNDIFLKFSNNLDEHFKTIALKTENLSQQNQQTTQNITTKHTNSNIISSNIDITSLSDREYRNFFTNIVYSLLEKDINNIRAYVLICEAIWGKISSLPTHDNEFITLIRPIDNNLLFSFKSKKEFNLENIKFLLSNLTLNPFWLDGIKIFCEFLKENKKDNIHQIISLCVKDLLLKFPNITKLKFNNKEQICSNETYNYFSNNHYQCTNNLKIESDKTDTNDNLDDINTLLKNIDASYEKDVFSKINSILNMVDIFKNNNMHNNAQILSIYAIDILENTLLKEYLHKEYEKLKKNIN